MIAINYKNALNNFEKYCNKVNEENKTIVITTENKKNVILLSVDQYSSLLKNKT